MNMEMIFIALVAYWLWSTFCNFSKKEAARACHKHIDSCLDKKTAAEKRYARSSLRRDLRILRKGGLSLVSADEAKAEFIEFMGAIDSEISGLRRDNDRDLRVKLSLLE